MKARHLCKKSNELVLELRRCDITDVYRHDEMFPFFDTTFVTQVHNRIGYEEEFKGK